MEHKNMECEIHDVKRNTIKFQFIYELWQLSDDRRRLFNI